MTRIRQNVGVGALVLVGPSREDKEEEGDHKEDHHQRVLQEVGRSKVLTRTKKRGGGGGGRVGAVRMFGKHKRRPKHHIFARTTHTTTRQTHR